MNEAARDQTTQDQANAYELASDQLSILGELLGCLDAAGCDPKDTHQLRLILAAHLQPQAGRPVPGPEAGDQALRTAPPNEVLLESLDIAALIARSSLGTPSARRVRNLTSASQVAEILRRRDLLLTSGKQSSTVSDKTGNPEAEPVAAKAPVQAVSEKKNQFRDRTSSSRHGHPAERGGADSRRPRGTRRKRPNHRLPQHKLTAVSWGAGPADAGTSRTATIAIPVDLRRMLAVALPNPLVFAWRWRYEIALVLGLSAGLAAAIISFGAVLPIVAVIGIILMILCWPMARRAAVDRAWCIITPHRVRVGCVEGLIYSSRGKIPIILWTSHRAFGERVLLWCRAGTSVDDFISARAVLAAACWAEDVSVFFDTQHLQLVTLDVIRRPTDLTRDLEDARSSDSFRRPPPWPGDEDA